MKYLHSFLLGKHNLTKFNTHDWDNHTSFDHTVGSLTLSFCLRDTDYTDSSFLVKENDMSHCITYLQVLHNSVKYWHSDCWWKLLCQSHPVICVELISIVNANRMYRRQFIKIHNNGISIICTHWRFVLITKTMAECLSDTKHMSLTGDKALSNR